MHPNPQGRRRHDAGLKSKVIAACMEPGASVAAVALANGLNANHAWLQLQRRQVPDGGAIAGAIAYSLNHWAWLTAHLDDGAVPIDNNFMERQLKPWQMGRKAWLFIGSELAGQRAAMVMSLVQSAKLNGHDPWAYLRNALARLPMHLNSRIDELLPHRRH